MIRRFAWFGAILFAALLFARAEGPDDKYLWIYNLIQEGDALNDSGQAREAVIKYPEAEAALKALRVASPGWNEKIVSYRLEYLASKLEPLGRKFPPTNQPPVVAGAEVSPGATLSTNQLKALQEEVMRLSAQNALLAAKLKEALSVQPAAVDPRELAKAEEKIKLLQKERDLLKVGLEQAQARAEQDRRVAEGAKPKPARESAPDELGRQLEEARTAIATLQASNLALHAEKTILQTRIADLARDPKLARRQSVSSSADYDRQLESALARLEVYDAQQVPYTPEELALFKQPDLKATVATEAQPPPKKPVELPPGAGPLFSEAERAIDAGRFDEAEKKLLDVLRQDEKNVAILANLAWVQIDQNHLADAEKNLKRALAVYAQDAASLYLMGRLKMLQEKYDEALEALSLSARLAPNRPQTQYWLGKALVEKGSRAQAETALRKAVQLRPGWGEAHYSLALVYATQQPPFKELAQWHYDKAVSSGYPRNPAFEKLLEEKRSVAVTPR